jgi:hypothetical protein
VEVGRALELKIEDPVKKHMIAAVVSALDRLAPQFIMLTKDALSNPNGTNSLCNKLM